MKMFSTLLTLMVMVFFSGPTVFAYSQTGNELALLSPKISVTQQEIRQEKQQMLLELKEKAKEERDDRKASISAKITERKKLLITDYWQRLTKRLDATINRLDNLIQRINSRLAKLEQTSSQEDISGVRTQLDNATRKLASAKTKLIVLNELIETTLDSESPKTAFEVVRNSVKEIKDILKEVHTILVHVIGDIRGLRVGNDKLNDLTPTLNVSPSATLSPSPTPTLTPSPEPTPTI